MDTRTVEEIRRCFTASSDFNEIFDAFEVAVKNRLNDVELYRQLFWNSSLTADEIRLFGEKLAVEFPETKYDIYCWLASVFEVTYATNDNYDLAFYYFQRAAEARPAEQDPYLDACDCYDPDLNVPPLQNLIDFLKSGLKHVTHPKALYKRLAYFYELAGDAEKAEECHREADRLDQLHSPDSSA
ncbi:MAG: hypothetical protein HY961_05425 [Ignavibacteriae bacterium]|nr:hypothetical protein [Ignavibacteriota bacterium]